MNEALLDLYCGGGGAGLGYSLAGFTVFGVDLNHMPRYPFPWMYGDAVTVLDHLLEGKEILINGSYLRLRDFAAIHASPPCQRYSYCSTMRPGLAEKYPDLIPPTRERLLATGLPYVIENVPGAPLHDPLLLCGSMFSLVGEWKETQVYLQRHREFETSFVVPAMECDHSIGHKAVTVAGHGRMGGHNGEWFKGPGYAKLTKDVMEIDWMVRDELNEAVPPAYTEYIGKYLIGEI